MSMPATILLVDDHEATLERVKRLVDRQFEVVGTITDGTEVCDAVAQLSPDVVVLDDLSSALDVETEQALWDRLSSDTGNATALVVSHRRPALQRADKVIVMRDGHIEAVGTADELLETSQEFRRLWSGDFESE